MSDDAPVPPPQHPMEYPPYVQSAEQRRRWDLSVAIARELLEVDGFPAPGRELWQMTRSIYQSETKT